MRKVAQKVVEAARKRTHRENDELFLGPGWRTHTETPNGNTYVNQSLPAVIVTRMNSKPYVMLKWEGGSQEFDHLPDAIQAAPGLVAKKDNRTALVQRVAGLVDHAHRELELAGLFDPSSDYDGALGHAVMDLIKLFSDQGHSGMSAATVSELFNQLSHYKALTPCDHTNQDHIQDVSDQGTLGTRTLQCRRVPSHFSNNGGQSWFDMDNPEDIAREQERLLGQTGVTSLVNARMAHLYDGLELLRVARATAAPLMTALATTKYVKPGAYCGRLAAKDDTIEDFLKKVEEADPTGALYAEGNFDDMPTIPADMEPVVDPSGFVGAFHPVAVEYQGTVPSRALVWNETAFRVNQPCWSIVDCEGRSLGLSEKKD